MKVKIQDVTFGSDSAERDYKQGFLSKVFLETAFYSRVQKGQSELVVGRKGAGKSAICLFLRETLRSEGMRVALLTPESLSQQKMQALQVNSINKEEFYLQTWKYILLVRIAFEIQEIVDHRQALNLHPQHEDLKAISMFLSQQGEKRKDFGASLTGMFKVFSKISMSIGLFSGDLEFQRSKESEDLIESISIFEDSLKRLLQYLNHQQIYILIDKVDEVWDDTEESKRMISGLLRAVASVNESLENVGSVVFLRSDIYDVLKFHDVDKYNSQTEFISWSKSNLRELLENRIRFSAGESKSNSTSMDIWTALFESRVGRDSSFEYIVSRTLRRPREAIQFCNRALRFAQDSGSEKITANHVLRAERQYSAEKLRDLSSEFLIQYPFLEGLFSLFQGFQTSFSKQEFEKRYFDAKERLENSYLDLKNLNSDYVLQILYEIVFIGVDMNEGQLFSYDISNLVMAQQKQYVVHPAFHSALGLKTQVIFSEETQEIVAINTNNSSFTQSNHSNSIGFQNSIAGGTVNQGEVIVFSQGDIDEASEILNAIKGELSTFTSSKEESESINFHIQAAIEALSAREPNKAFIAKRLIDAIEMSTSGVAYEAGIELSHSRKVLLNLRRISKWLGVSSSYFQKTLAQSEKDFAIEPKTLIEALAEIKRSLTQLVKENPEPTKDEQAQHIRKALPPSRLQRIIEITEAARKADIEEIPGGKSVAAILKKVREQEALLIQEATIREQEANIHETES